MKSNMNNLYWKDTLNVILMRKLLQGRLILTSVKLIYDCPIQLHFLLD